jgi:hypothetical protein
VKNDFEFDLKLKKSIDWRIVDRKLFEQYINEKIELIGKKGLGEIYTKAYEPFLKLNDVQKDKLIQELYLFNKEQRGTLANEVVDYIEFGKRYLVSYLYT